MLVSFNAASQAKSYKVKTYTTATALNDTLTNTDTLYATIADVPDEVQALRAYLTKVDGDCSSVRVYLQARHGAASTDSDGDWDTLDSLVCTNVTTNKKQFNIRTTSGNLLYVDYRLFGKGAGTTNTLIKVYQVKRRNNR